MRRAIVRASNLADAAILRVAIAALVLLTLVVLIQVVARYIFFQPPIWTEEAARYLMIWAGLLGATLSFKRGFDPALFRSETPNGRVPAVLIVQSFAVLVFVLPALFFSVFGPGLQVSRGFLMRHARTYAETLDVSTLFVAVSVPVSLSVILLHLAARWARG